MTEQMVTDFPKDIRVLVGFIQGLTDHLAHWDKSQWASAVLGRSDVSLHTSPAFPVNKIKLFCCRVSSPRRRPPRPAGGSGGGRAHGTPCVPGGRGCVTPGATRARTATRHTLADAAGSHRHWTAESAAAGVCSQQVEGLLTPLCAETWI